MKSESNSAVITAPSATRTNGRRGNRTGSGNTYSMKCTLTGQTVATNPKLNAKRTEKYGVTEQELRGSYIGEVGADMLVQLTQKGTPAKDAVIAIRQSFGQPVDAPINDAIVAHIVAKVPAKDKKAQQVADFEKRKEEAMKNLGLVTTPTIDSSNTGTTTSESEGTANPEVSAEPAAEVPATTEAPAPEASDKGSKSSKRR